MERPNEEIITLKAQMRDLTEEIRRLKISMMGVQEKLLKLGKNETN